MLRTINGSNVAQSADDVQMILRRMRDSRVIGYDAETTGLDPWVNKIVGHVITFGPAPSDTYYVPVRHGEPQSGNIEQALGFEREFADIALDRGITWVGHNVQFDLRFLLAHGIKILGQVEDTMVNAALLDEYASSFSLDACCRAAGVQEKRGEELYQHLAALFGGEPTRAQMANFWRLAGDDPVGTDYATGDGVSTWQLRDAQWEKLAYQQLESVAELERRITRVVYRMTSRGVQISRQRLQEVQDFAEQKAMEAEKQLPEGFNPWSPKDIQKLMEANGHTNWPLTLKKKLPQFNEEWLKTNEPGRNIIALRKFRHLQSAFIEPMRDRHIRPDGRVHAQYHQMATDDFGTITGRFSCSDPNLQQVPKRNRLLGLPFRRIFVPDEGCRWLSADLAQCEPRILAHYSEAKALVEGYTIPPFKDAHSAVTIQAGLEEMLGIPFKEAREFGKRLNQTLLTGGGKAKIVSMLGARGAEIYDAYFEAMPEVRRLLKQASRRMTSRGYVKSLLGRRARLEAPDKGYKAANRLFQCGNADVIKQGLADMDDYFESEGDDVYLLNTVHDSVDINVPEGREEVAKRGLGFLCQFGPGRRFNLLVPMAAEWAIGEDWGDATYEAEKFMMGEDPHDPTFKVAEVAHAE